MTHTGMNEEAGIIKNTKIESDGDKNLYRFSF